MTVVRFILQPDQAAEPEEEPDDIPADVSEEDYSILKCRRF